ncbi:virulence factor TspB C-terminal domain-related protein [Alcanivorax sp.]|uniref:virulence factor TspB C-terminal domain-related protein n=1 Tax=Alcanivorax sp. TaxID=1872427 RepID=UPI003BAC76E3
MKKLLTLFTLAAITLTATTQTAIAEERPGFAWTAGSAALNANDYPGPKPCEETSYNTGGYFLSHVEESVVGPICYQWSSTNTHHTQQVFFGCRFESHPHLIDYGGSNGNYYATCSDEAPPPPECAIPEGQVRSIFTNYRLSPVCFQNCKFEQPKKTICIYLQDGTSRCMSDYTSTGDYCDAEDGASAAAFEDYVDEDGCYNSTDGHRYCESPVEAQCPNYTTVNGKKYCREPEDDDSFDSDGDGLPDVEDPFPDNPDGDGDGLTDNNDPDPGNADADGDGTPDGQDDDPDGDGEPGYNGGSSGDGDDSKGAIGEGDCDPGSSVKAPECDKDLDGIHCAIFLNNWQARCEETQRYHELYGTPEDRQEYADKGADFLDPENPENRLPGIDENGQYGPNDTVVNFTEVANSIDDTGFLAGSCPSDITYSVFGNSFSLSYQPICQLLQTINPVIVALGWFSAALILARAVTSGG